MINLNRFVVTQMGDEVEVKMSQESRVLDALADKAYPPLMNLRFASPLSRRNQPYSESGTQKTAGHLALTEKWTRALFSDLRV
jgi:hypothetical protein